MGAENSNFSCSACPGGDNAENNAEELANGALASVGS